MVTHGGLRINYMSSGQRVRDRVRPQLVSGLGPGGGFSEALWQGCIWRSLLFVGICICQVPHRMWASEGQGRQSSLGLRRECVIAALLRCRPNLWYGHTRSLL